MLTVLKPQRVIPKPVETPQCCVEVGPPSHATMWRLERYAKLRPHFNANLCQRESVFQHDGKCYCRIHAGQLALELWLNGRLKETK